MRKDGKLRTTLQDFSVSRIQVETEKDILEIVVNKVTESSSNIKAGRKHKHGRKKVGGTCRKRWQIIAEFHSAHSMQTRMQL